MSKKLYMSTLAALGASLAMGAAGAAHAITNLVTNGSFESGLTGWTIGGVDNDSPPYPPVAILYNSATPYPTGAFGEAVPQNNAPTISPDPVGDRAAYFVSDFAVNQSLSQTVFLNPGMYQIGFSAYAPANGFSNAGDATFSGIVTVLLANYAVSAGPSTTWQTFSGVTNIAAAGNYLVEFVFNTNFRPSKDIVIDQVYVVPEPIPEPGTYALLLAGIAMLGFMTRRRMR